MKSEINNIAEIITNIPESGNLFASLNVSIITRTEKALLGIDKRTALVISRNMMKFSKCFF